MNWYKLKYSFTFPFGTLVTPLMALAVIVSSGMPAWAKDYDRSQSILKEYLQIQQDFSKEFCSPAKEAEFWKLFQAYRGTGHYLPQTEDDKMDRETITKFIPQVKTKIKWIELQIKQLEKQDNFIELTEKLVKFNKMIDKLLLFKEKYHETDNAKLKAEYEKDSKLLLGRFKYEFDKYLSEVSFLRSFNFPNEHLELRRQYDEFKDVPKKKQKANEVYFFRKLVEDGSQEPDRSASDMYLRSTLDSIYLRLQVGSSFLNEDLRYDIEASLEGIKKQLGYGKQRLLGRMNEWLERTKQAQDFYTALLKNSVEIDGKQLTADQIFEQKSTSRLALRDYVLKKQAQVYKYWVKQSGLYRSLYVIETILYNEVGDVDGIEALERKDVAKVTYNRSVDDFYSRIGTKDALFEYLSMKQEKLDKYKWLNLLFKEGEFSFTYYYIAGNLRIYCPDMSKKGKFLRNQNVLIGLDTLKRDKNNNFEATRYYSRASMIGRIPMEKLWKDHEKLPEMPGTLIAKSKGLKKLYHRGKYRFLYYFTDHKGERYKVVEIKHKNYAISLASELFFEHRNAHYFTYFKPLPAENHKPRLENPPKTSLENEKKVTSSR